MRSSEAQSSNASAHRPVLPTSVTLFVALVALASVAATVLATVLAPTPDLQTWPALLAFFALGVISESMDVRFRLHGEVESLNLFEAVLAPLVFAFAGPVAIVVVAAAQLSAGIARRNDAIKIIFNTAQWVLITACASIVITQLGDGTTEITLVNMWALLLAMIVGGVINQLALTTVIRLAQRRPIGSVIHGLSPVIIPGWLVGWGLNTFVGALFVLAYHSSAYAVVLFWVPLAVLHAAYRGYAGTESDRMRLAGLHRSSRILSSSGDFDQVVASFLAEVCRCFEANAAELLLVTTEGIVIHQVRGGESSTYSKTIDVGGNKGLRASLVARGATSRIGVGVDDPLNQALQAEGWRDCLMAPLPSDNLLPGVLIVYNQDGLEGFEEGERAVLEALARETASTFEKGKLFAAVVEERHKLSQIVDSTSDGVLSLTAEGIVRSWNPAWAQITGYTATSAVGRRLSETLTIYDLDGRPVPIEMWVNNLSILPDEVQLEDRSGNMHWLECLYRPEVDEDGTARVLVMVARDMSDVRQIERLRKDVDRLSELEAAQRNKVLQLQESLQPPMPIAAEAEFGVYYQPSDTFAPTGGDFYDWQVLPGGDVHIAVVDVLGTGVEATNDAFAVIHTLRTLAFQGMPVESLVREADHLLASLDNDLVATVICVRYNPPTGRVRLAGGGHPPPLLVRSGGEVEEVAAPGIPVGWPGAGSDAPVDVQLAPSDTLVLYTDGLVEAHRDILRGLEALAETAGQTRSLPAPDLARALVERSLEGAARRDDSLALVLRHCGPVLVDVPSGFGHRAMPVAEQVPVVRHQFLAWISQYEQVRDLGTDLAVVVTELATNAVRVAHGYFEVRATIAGGGIVLEVEDDGPGFEETGILSMEPNLEDESGRGLFIVKSLVDEMHVRSTGRGCVVRLFKRSENWQRENTSDAQPSAASSQAPI